ncbi:MAG: S-layer homology domain-containing protein [Chloroflexota bacterium]
MTQTSNRRNTWRFLAIMLLALGMLVTGGVALAGVPAGIPGGVTAAPPAQSQGVPQTQSTGTSANSVAPAAPAAPNVVLYDQYDNDSGGNITSQDFDAANAAYTNQAADDFVVPAGQTWTVTGVDVSGQYSAAGPAVGYNVYFYNNAGTLPGAVVATRLSQAYTGGADPVITLATPVVLSAGTYWVSVQARMDFTPGGQWYWQGRSVQAGSPAAWQNPGDGFATGCTTWGVKTVCIPSQIGADQMFRLNGTTGGGGTATSTSVATSTPAGTPTCAPSAGGWTAGAPLTAGIVRAWGVYFPANGKFYSMGGRTGDGDPNLAQMQPLEYTPGTDTWVQKTASFSDNQTSNMQGAVLTMSGTPVIVMVGGSAGGGTSGTSEVKTYNPATDTMTTLSSDPWTPGTTTLPGGVAVVNNKLYVLGGFEINVGMSDQIWEFDPAAAAGSRWTLKSTVLPVQLGYIPTAAIGGMIYTGGGSIWDGTTLLDSDNSYKYDPATNTITAITNIPRATAETRAVAYGGKMWVLGGGRDAPNPSTEVDIYDPATNSWSTGPSFTLARRNFPADTDGTKIYMAGGYAPTAPDPSMEIYSPGAACGTATATVAATNTVAPTNTAPAATSTVAATNTAPAATSTAPAATATQGAATATATACTLEFADVLPGNTFYPFIKCLACRNIINGYPCGGTGEPCNGNSDPYFRPSNSVTRGQLAKVVSQSAGFSDPVSGQTFEDVVPGSTFYDYIERLASRGVMGGYPCGIDPNESCIAPENRPYFRPSANATRGQLTKIVSNAAGFNDPDPATFTFTDVPAGSTFHVYVERLLINRPGAMNGYPCGVDPTEPCDSQSRPYFRPNATLSRGQTSKIVANTFFPNCQTPQQPVKASAPNN